MPRPVFAPNEEQQQLLEALTTAARTADEQEERTWALMKQGRDAGIPDTVLCDLANRSRATLNRRYGPRTDTPPEPATT